MPAVRACLQARLFLGRVSEASRKSVCRKGVSRKGLAPGLVKAAAEGHVDGVVDEALLGVREVEHALHPVHVAPPLLEQPRDPALDQAVVELALVHLRVRRSSGPRTRHARAARVVAGRRAVRARGGESGGAGRRPRGLTQPCADVSGGGGSERVEVARRRQWRPQVARRVPRTVRMCRAAPWSMLTLVTLASCFVSPSFASSSPGLTYTRPLRGDLARSPISPDLPPAQ